MNASKVQINKTETVGMNGKIVTVVHEGEILFSDISKRKLVAFWLRGKSITHGIVYELIREIEISDFYGIIGAK
jgi:hypothetical protein